LLEQDTVEAGHVLGPHANVGPVHDPPLVVSKGLPKGADKFGVAVEGSREGGLQEQEGAFEDEP
jgi:hypothetical protein